MPKLAAGILLHRRKNDAVEVFLVHPGGPFWAKKDNGAWSLPKGEYSETEDPLVAAKREFKEETGHDAPTGEYISLGEVKYGNKKLQAWATEGDVSAKVKSNVFEMEWPPRSGKMQSFPEVDRGGWFTLARAKTKLVKGQVALIDALAARLNVASTEEVTDQLSLL